MKDAFGAVVETEEHIAIVIERAAFDKRCEIGGKLANLQAGDILGEVFGMSADVADAACGT